MKGKNIKDIQLHMNRCGTRDEAGKAGKKGGRKEGRKEERKE